MNKIPLHPRKRKERSSQTSLEGSEDDPSLQRRTQPKLSKSSPHAKLYSIDENGHSTPRSCLSWNTTESTSHTSSITAPSPSSKTSRLVRESSSSSIRNTIMVDFESESCRLALDDCSYLCSNIASVKKEGTAIKHCKGTAKSSCELATMLQSTKMRQILFNAGNDHISECNSKSVLDLVLNLFNVMGPCHSESIRNVQVEPTKLNARTKTARIGITVMGDGRSHDTHFICPADYDQIFRYAMSTIAYTLSLDCTIHKTLSASKTRAVAQRIQDTLLRHHNFLRGLLRIISHDSLIQSIHEKMNHQDSDKKSSSYPIKPILAQTEILNTPTRGLDPTLVGRRKARKARDSPRIGLDPHNELGFHSDEKSLGTFSQQESYQTEHSLLQNIEKVLSRIFTESQEVAALAEDDVCLICKDFLSFRYGDERLLKLDPSLISLYALNKILSGLTISEEDENAGSSGGGYSSEEVNTPDVDNLVSTYDNPDGDEVEMSNSSNALIFKNVMMRQSDSLNVLAHTLLQALRAASYFFNITDPVMRGCEISTDGKGSKCHRCFLSLKEKILILTSIIDGACCLSAPNRKVVCNINANKSAQVAVVNVPFIEHLISFITTVTDIVSNYTSPNEDNLLISSWYDISTNILRLLTSLTHENELAAKQIVSCSRGYGNKHSGVVSLLHFFHRITTIQGNSSYMKANDHGKILREKRMHFYYDCTIFTLNIFSNLAESSQFQEVRTLFMNTMFDGNQSALLWLAQWAVTQTDPFRDHATESNDSSIAGTDRDNRIDRREGESLVTAGNAFILLACMMRESFRGKEDSRYNTTTNEMLKMTDDARNVICGQLPKDATTGESRVQFIIKILTAFCNYYHYSIGELSAAVIGPVKGLLLELGEMGNELDQVN